MACPKAKIFKWNKVENAENPENVTNATARRLFNVAEKEVKRNGPNFVTITLFAQEPNAEAFLKMEWRIDDGLVGTCQGN